MSTRGKVWFHRSRALGWLGLGIASFIMGWQNMVSLVWGASVYANVVSDWSAAEAADDREIIKAIQSLRRTQRGSRSHWPRRLREQVNGR